MRMTLERKILTGFISCAIILFGVTIFSSNNSKKFIESNALVDQTNQVVFQFEKILISTVNAESGTRGFVISGDNNFLDLFLDAQAKGVEHLNKVQELTKDNPNQQKNIVELDKELKMRFDHLNRTIEFRKKDLEKAKELVASGEGKQIQDRIRKIIDRAEGMEFTLLAERRQTSIDDASNFNIVFVILLLIIILVLVIVYIIVISNLRALKRAEAETAGKNWLLTGNTELNDKLKGDQSIKELACNTISYLCTYLKANIGAIYQFDDKESALLLCGQYAFSTPNDTKVKFVLNEGLIGQAAREQKQISLTDLTDEQIRITSSVLNAKPKNLLITPFLFEGKTVGVIEMGRLTDFNETEKEFIAISMDSIGISVNSAISRKRIQELLEETQVQSEELQSQQEELKQMNEELEEQTQNLIAQQEELQITNEELEEQTQSLEEKNKEVEASRNDIEQKTKQLEISSRYKSEFLANMSHELRTPLNSLLILSKDLSENRKNNLDAIQVESAEIIYRSGTDLLMLINEVLDLSKIEAGKMSLNIESVSLRYFADDIVRIFKHSTEQKGLELTCKLDATLPETIRTDLQRLNQIVKNLLSNAIKFTEQGSVNLTIDRDTETTLNISVKDTGIGIQEDKQMAVF